MVYLIMMISKIVKNFWNYYYIKYMKKMIILIQKKLKKKNPIRVALKNLNFKFIKKFEIWK